MNLRAAPEQMESVELLRALADARHELKAVRYQLGINICSIIAIERGLEAQRLSVGQAFDLMDWTWPDTDPCTPYSFGPAVARQASHDAHQATRRKSKRRAWQ